MRAKHYLTKNKKDKRKKKTKKYSRKGASAKQSNNRFNKEIMDLNSELENLIAERKKYAEGMAMILMAKKELDKKILLLQNELRSILEVSKTITDDNDREAEELIENFNLKNSELLQLKSDREKINYTISSFDYVLQELSSNINDIRDRIKYYEDYAELVVI